MQLEKEQRNAIFEAITTAGLDPGDFELDPGGDDTEARVSHQGSGSYCTVAYAAGAYSGSRVVGEGPVWPYKVYSWSAAEGRVARWLAEVKADLETPDLWAELRREPKMLGAAPAEAAENTPFTAAEQREIATQFREIRESAKERYALSEEEMRALEARLDYLEDAAGRLGRLDWRSVLAGTLLTAVVEAVLPPEAIRGILMMLGRFLAQLFVPELPPPGY